MNPTEIAGLITGQDSLAASQFLAQHVFGFSLALLVFGPMLVAVIIGAVMRDSRRRMLLFSSQFLYTVVIPYMVVQLGILVFIVLGFIPALTSSV